MLNAEALNAEALRALAALLRAGHSPRAGLVLWHEYAPPPLVGELERLARRLTMGASLDDALRMMREGLGDEVDVVRCAFSLRVAVGADPAAILERAAADLQERDTRSSAGSAASAGARLSARMIAGMPLLAVPFMPAAGAPFFDATGVATVVLGILLAVAGMRWVGRLVPRPPAFGDPVARIAELVAAGLRGGASLHLCMNHVCDLAAGDLRDEMIMARRRVLLGLTWSDSLERSMDESLRALGRVLRRAEKMGVPVAETISSFAATRREQRAQAYEGRLRRAPVLMALPLTLCVLPSYVLLSLTPFLRGASPG